MKLYKLKVLITLLEDEFLCGKKKKSLTKTRDCLELCRLFSGKMPPPQLLYGTVRGGAGGGGPWVNGLLCSSMRPQLVSATAYDVPLMYRSLDLLKQALTEGQISLIEYFVETESIYKNLQAYMQIENQYQKVMANIYKNNL